MKLSAQEKTLVKGHRVDRKSLESLHNWYPIALDLTPDTAAPELWWRFLGDRRLTSAFFADSLLGQASRERLACHTSLSALDEFHNSVEPTAFIFHVSRCGSTLLTQMLATLPECIVVSEPPVLDSFFRALHHQPDLAAAQAIFKKLIAALGQRRSAQEQHLIVKLDSWHTPWMSWLSKLYPHTPIVFLYRQPREVLASHRRQRGPQMVPGLLDTGALIPDLAGLMPADIENYGARVLDAIFNSALESLRSMITTRPAELINYAELPAALWKRLLPLFSMKTDDATLHALQTRAQFHSKHGTQQFDGDRKLQKRDGLDKSHGTPPTCAEECHEQLETMRLARRY